MIKLQKISHSGIKDYLKCPKLFYYRHILKIRLPEKPLPLLFGSALHKALELYEKKDKDPIEVFTKAFKLEMLDETDAEQYEKERENGIRLLEHFLDERSNGKLRKYTITKTEQYFNRPLVYPDTRKKAKIANFTGVVDFITSTGSLGDYKTSSKKYSQEQVDQSLQPDMYYLWYYLTYGKLPRRFIYIVFLKKRKRDPIQVLVTKRTLSDLVKLVTLIDNIATQIQKGMFQRTHNEHTYCDCYKYEEFFNSTLKNV